MREAMNALTPSPPPKRTAGDSQSIRHPPSTHHPLSTSLHPPHTLHLPPPTPPSRFQLTYAFPLPLQVSQSLQALRVPRSGRRTCFPLQYINAVVLHHERSAGTPGAASITAQTRKTRPPADRHGTVGSPACHRDGSRCINKHGGFIRFNKADFLAREEAEPNEIYAVK